MIGLVEAAYACAFAPGRLQAFLQLLDGYLGVAGSYCLLVGAEGVQIRSATGASGAVASQHASFSGLLSVSSEAVRTLPSGVALALRGLPDVFGTGGSGEYGTGWGHGIAAAVAHHGSTSSLIVVPRPFEETRSAATVTQAMQAVLPYLRRPFQLAHATEGSLLPLPGVGQLLRVLPMACLISDSAGRCLDANERFQRILPAVSMRVVAGRVRFDDHYLQASWQSALVEAWETAVPRVIAAAGGNGMQWRLHLLPIQCLALEQEPVSRHLILALFEEQRAQQRPLPDSFSAVGKLTPAEMDVLSGLLQGYTAKVIAKSRGASVNTVRSQIMAILGKTGHRSQKELIAAFGASSFGPSSLDSLP